MNEATKAGGKKFGIFSYNYETAGRGPARWGFLVLVPFLIILGGWATFAPLNAAAIATGEVVLNQDRKTVQYLEGGIVDNILIGEGEEIERGQPILIIRDISQRTRINMIYNQLASARAVQSRLVAERDGLQMLDFSKLADSIDLPKPELLSLRNTQTKLFISRQTSLKTKIELIEARKIASQKQIEGLKAELKAMRTQHRLAQEEMKIVAGLFKKKIATTQRKMATERTNAELEGQIGSLEADIARLEESILAADIEVIDLQTDTQNAVLQQLQEVDLSIQDLTHQMGETLDQLERTIIKAPSSGRIMDLQVHTKGAVVQPGARILDIVPDDDRLIVEAKLNPNDIDLVNEGVKAKVLLSAYKAKKVPKLDGEVLHVSADILTDKTTGERYFLARVLVDDNVLNNLKADVSLYPGMPAQVFFLAGERTVADYMLSPVLDATYRAFREE